MRWPLRQKNCVLRNVLFTRQQMVLQPTSATSEPRVSLFFHFSVFAFGNGKHFLFLWFISSGAQCPGGTGLRGLRLSSSIAVGNQSHHQIGSSDSHGEYWVDQGEVSLSEFCLPWKTRENQTKGNTVDCQRGRCL